LKICDFSISKIVMNNSDGDMDSIGFSSLKNAKHTTHITTRPYRAPEVALLYSYNNKIDIWSTGCIFAELLLLQTY
jgi:serine/threonine protein kinase